MSSRWMAVLQQRQANLSKENVTCQKCLQKGHWTYECKNPRKYVHRTSRTSELKKKIKQVNKRNLTNDAVDKKKRKRSSSSSDSSSSSSDSNSSSSGHSSGSEDSDSDSSSSSSSSSTSIKKNSSSDSSDTNSSGSDT